VTAGPGARRAAIVEATLRVIGERGADAVTHRAVAAAAGVPLASTTYYFASKDELVREAFALAIERSLALVEAHAAGVDGPVVDRLVALAEAQLEDPGAPLAAQFELMLEAGRRPQLRDLAARWDERYRAAVAELVGDEVDVDVALCLLEGALINQVAFPVEGFVEGPLRRMLERVARAW
jgi:DNA-binding transcriptional regulator YbjK